MENSFPPFTLADLKSWQENRHHLEVEQDEHRQKTQLLREQISSLTRELNKLDSEYYWNPNRIKLVWIQCVLAWHKGFPIQRGRRRIDDCKGSFAYRLAVVSESENYGQ